MKKTGNIRIWYDGKRYTVNENDTIKTLKTKVLNFPPEMMLLDEESRLLKDKKKVKETGLRDGDAVIPIVKPEFGS